jgi:antiviral helicase SKI2
MCKNEVHAISDLFKMMQGKPMKLESEFRLTYSMILNLLRVERLRVEEMMMRSFSEIDRHRKEKSLEMRLAELQKRKANLPSMRVGGLEAELGKFYELASSFIDLYDGYRTLLFNQQGVAKALAPGRIVLINIASEVNVPAVVLAVDAKSLENNFTVLTLLSGLSASSAMLGFDGPRIERYYSLAESHFMASSLNITSSEHSVFDIKASALVDITRTTLKIDGEKVINDVNRRQLPRFQDAPIGQSTVAVVEMLQRYCNDLHNETDLDLMNWLNDFRIQDITLLGVLQKMAAFKTEMSELSVAKSADFRSGFVSVYDRQTIEKEVTDIQWALGEDSLKNMDDYHRMIDVLRSLKYIDTNRTVQLKGRVACEMGSHDLLVTELVFDNVLTDRPPTEIAALLSCLVFQQRNCSPPELTTPLEQGIEAIKKCALTIGQTQRACGMKESEQEYVEQFNFGLVEVVYEWARGKPFGEIVALTDVQEGVIVRTIQRLDEALRDVKDAARVIGDPMLYQKMDEASTIIKRDIVFAASLYTQ